MRGGARVVALAVAAVATGLIAGVLLLARDDDARTVPEAFTRGVLVRTSIEPRAHLFGDPVTAHVEVRFDKRRVRADRLRLDAVFRPYEQTGPERRQQSDLGDVTRLRVSYPLQCLARACSPGGPRRQMRFPPVRVHYAFRDVRDRATATADWPPVDAVSRLGPFDIQEARWRADLDAPQVTYRASPGWLAVALGGSALALALGACLLAWRLLERRPEEEVDAAPAETRPPLERALEHVGLVSANGDVPGRRRALERLARELERVDEATLAVRARRLAWAPGQPERSEIDRLTADVRSATEETGR